MLSTQLQNISKTCVLFSLILRTVSENNDLLQRGLKASNERCLGRAKYHGCYENYQPTKNISYFMPKTVF